MCVVIVACSDMEDSFMKGAKTVKIVIVVIVLAALILGYYYYLSHKSGKEQTAESVQVTAEQSVLMKDLERNYPPTPKEVLKYYCQITRCFYNEEYSEEELHQLAAKIQELYDEELIANKTQEDYLNDLKTEIAQMKQDQYTIASYDISASTDVEYFAENGRSCARMYCTFNLKKAGSTGTVASMEQFVLREDEDGHWKILGWELAEQ